MTKLGVRCATAALVALTAPAFAEAIPDPDSHRLVVENDYVRVFEVQLSTGTTLPMHAHPPRVVVALSPTRIKLISENGRAQILDQKLGDVFWYDASAQALEVITGTLHQIETEIKPAAPAAFSHAAKDMTEITPELAHVLVENDRVRVLDLRGEPGQQYPFHFHPPRVGVRLGAARMKFQAKDGTISLADFHVGEASWGNFVEHTDAVVTGSFHMVVIEMKPQKQPQ